MTNKIDKNQKALIVISLLTAACLLGDSMLYIVLPTHWQEAGLNSLWEVGILLSVNRFVRLPLNPFISWLYGRLSSRNGILLAGLLAVCTTISYGFIQGFAMWLLMRCIWGIAWTLLRLGAYFTIIQISDETNRGYFMGTYNGLYRLGSLGGMLFGGLFGDLYGIAVPAVLFGTISLLALPFARELSTTAFKFENEQKNDFTEIIKNSDVLWTLFTGLFVAMVYQGILMSSLSYLIQIHDLLSIFSLQLSIGGASIAGILQALRWSWEPCLAPWIGRVSDGKKGRIKILQYTLFLAAFLFLLLPSTMPAAIWLILILLILVTATVLTTIVDTVACDVASCFPAKTFMSLHSFAIDIGAALGPITSYTISNFYGPYLVYYIVAAGLLLIGIKWVVRPVSGLR